MFRAKWGSRKWLKKSEEEKNGPKRTIPWPAALARSTVRVYVQGEVGKPEVAKEVGGRKEWPKKDHSMAGHLSGVFR
nr:hypothetical protein [Tanacetum cinerariifolium]